MCGVKLSTPVPIVLGESEGCDDITNIHSDCVPDDVCGRHKLFPLLDDCRFSHMLRKCLRYEVRHARTSRETEYAKSGIAISDVHGSSVEPLQRRPAKNWQIRTLAPGSLVMGYLNRAGHQDIHRKLPTMFFRPQR
ncbi:hypothetical protein T265_03413 [Opisthorchis viverrini]|uniref:Uncharacterized protein n=1 Tax=Opisthorchis viverrini TaxID=6198 RepID=A0A075A383_OPIVI|nr:hypothetical protein T265_03413 [Opisthorchis viverrini]KER30035.1 hypothetical protein T265_03413 [Opisthorchis viverrini]